MWRDNRRANDFGRIRTNRRLERFGIRPARPRLPQSRRGPQSRNGKTDYAFDLSVAGETRPLGPRPLSGQKRDVERAQTTGTRTGRRDWDGTANQRASIE
jgi:hypothetical protein